jgi:hypothetical protein
MKIHTLLLAVALYAASTAPALAQNAACTMMTLDEANKFAAGKVKSLNPTAMGGVTMCEYKDKFVVFSLQLFPHTLTGPQQMDVARKQYSGAVPVAGVADEAFLSKSLQTLVFRKKNTVVKISGLFLEQWEKQLPEIAKFIQDRVPQ